MKPRMVATPEFDQILEMLWDNDETVRESGMKNLAEFQKEMKDPGLQVGLKALRAAARLYPFEKPEPGSVSAELKWWRTPMPHPVLAGRGGTLRQVQ